MLTKALMSGKLNNLFVRIFIFSIILYLFFGITKYHIVGGNWGIYFVNLISMIFFYLIIFYCFKLNKPTEKKLLTIVFIYNLIFVSLYIYLFFSYTGEIFEFTGSDSLIYHDFSNFVASKNIIDGIQELITTTKHGFDDVGFVFYLSIIYSLFDSPLVGRFINIILNTFTVLLLFRIAKQFMVVKLAFIASIIFGIASFTVYYQASGLKETLMLLLIVYAYYHYYLYLKNPGMKHLLFFITLTLLLMFFRIGLVIFISASIFTTEFLKKKSRISPYRFAIITLTLLLIIYVVIFHNVLLLGYTRAFNPYLATELGHITPSTFLRFTALLAGIFGPFPTVTPVLENRDTVMHAPTLILKAFLSSYFLFSLFIAWKRKAFVVLPLIFFSLLHIMSLSYIVHTFKLRNQFPHLAFIILISFYVINILYSKAGYRRVKYLIYGINSGMVFILFFWNYLRF